MYIGNPNSNNYEKRTFDMSVSEYYKYPSKTINYAYGASIKFYLDFYRFSLGFGHITDSITINFTVDGITETETIEAESGYSSDFEVRGFNGIKYADLDGSFKPFVYTIDITTANSAGVYMDDGNGGYVPFHIEGVYNYEPSNWSGYKPQNASIIGAPNFSDEENPTITYSRSSKESLTYVVGNIQAVISLDGSNDDIVRDINLDDKTITSITFDLTEEERNLLRTGVQGSNSKQILFRIKTIPKEGVNADNIPPFYSDLSKTLTIAGAYVEATLEVEDIDTTTLALTGDKNTIVKYYSDAAYVINATATKGATITSEEVVCGNKSSTTETGVLENVESGEFTFIATDSRNNAVSGTLVKNFVDYVKLTCQQQIEIDLSGAEGTGAAATVKISGNYFNGSFGAVDNSLVVQIRHTQNDGSMGDWVTLTDFMDVSISNNSYSLDFGVSGLDYAEPYTFQCRAIDKLATAETAEYTTRVMPVFDWSEEDFNFNVPVNIEADTLNMEGNTVLRYTGSNSVLSGNNGNIYLRPGGTDDTTNETIFYSNGNITFGGAASFNSSIIIGGYILNDYVIEYGEEAMGSNGTWYWRKWLSGKAECWGCRNFGNMGISTAFGSLYRSAIFNQELPTNLFKTTPDVINIQLLNGGDGCWIAKWNDVAPSAAVSGSFIVINPVSGNISPSNIGFYVAGLSK